MQCPLKFRYRYFEGLYGAENGDLKESFQKGSRFHLLAERYFKGIHVEEEYIEDSELRGHFEKLKENYPLRDDWIYFSEYDIRERTKKIRLMARYDLIIIKPNNRVEIVDFKTNRRRFSQEDIEGSLQTKIYLYLLKENFKFVFENIRKIKKLDMIYYQTEYPEENLVIKYDDEDHEKSREKLEEIIENIGDFDFTTYQKKKVIHCEKCEFKIFCWKSKKKY
jgi:hypothetical protein